MSQQEVPERPTLEKEPVAFQTIKDTSMGALLGAGIGAAVSGLGVLIDKKSFSGREVANWAAWIGAGSGLGTYIRSTTRNDERARTKPYVERLEQELLAKNGALDTHLPPR